MMDKLQDFFYNHSKVIFLAMVPICVVVVILALWSYVDRDRSKRADFAAVMMKPDLTLECGESVKISNLIDSLNGELVTDYEITADELGKIYASFAYYNPQNKYRTYSFVVDVVDTTPPAIYGVSEYYLPIKYGGDLTDIMLSGDNLDDRPNREILGDYDLSKPGSYQLEYSITDSSNNVTKKPFTLHIYAPSTDDNAPSGNPLPKLNIADVVQEHKNSHTKIGIDVSSWQGEINWGKVKKCGAEFAFIRIGYQVGYGGEYVIDKYFYQNIEGALAVGLPVGIYFYSYANSVDEAKSQAEWIVNHLGNYAVELGVAFDWEDWGNFNSTEMSFRTINRVAKTFLDTIQKSGYSALNYGSKVYLERIWRLPDYGTWLAQYYDYVTYDGDYLFWQMSNTGRIDGIYGDVDIDIMYLR